MIDEDIAIAQKKNEKWHANIEKLMKESNIDELRFLNPLNDNKPESSLPPSLTRRKNEFRSKLESIYKMEPPKQSDLEEKIADFARTNQSNDKTTSFPKETSKKESVEDEDKKLRSEVERLRKVVDCLKQTVDAKDRERSDLVEDFKDKERRIFKDQDSNIARLKKEYDYKIQNLQAKIDEKNEVEVKLSHKYDLLKEESLVKDAIIQKLNDKVVQKDKQIKQLWDEIDVEKQKAIDMLQAERSEQPEEEIYHDPDVKVSDEEQEYLNLKSRLEASDKRIVSRLDDT
ncbi:hypothetical protein CANMA_003355 [Candida margitis]|uniref:uncharacterized protein n=1 Tax=Candida margitis TaxID=1775924 RepID=UPI002226DE6F|nr:uncharacterized protein CANMA_003355 [Candida margitis]KAI5966109.1 hypothetical protein CANMA_003355 [Candida margitis]